MGRLSSDFLTLVMGSQHSLASKLPEDFDWLPPRIWPSATTAPISNEPWAQPCHLSLFCCQLWDSHGVVFGVLRIVFGVRDLRTLTKV